VESTAYFFMFLDTTKNSGPVGVIDVLVLEVYIADGSGVCSVLNFFLTDVTSF
jgi:hypothetical protein